MKRPLLTHGARANIGLAADVVAIGGVVITAAAVAVAVVSQQPLVGMAIAPVALGVVCCALLVSRRGLSRQLRARDLDVDDLRGQLSLLQRSATPAPAANRWLSTPRDLLNFDLSHAELERCLALAKGVARSGVGPDAEVEFLQISLTAFEDPSSPSVWFDAYSPAADKTALLICNGNRSDCYLNSSQEGDHRGSDGIEAPWRDGETWIELVRKSWLRIKPFQGQADLFWRAGEWQVIYRPEVDGVQRAAAEFALRDGTLVKL
jgi:hypothetical protein